MSPFESFESAGNSGENIAGTNSLPSPVMCDSFGFKSSIRWFSHAQQLDADLA
jgi:hypothetical protein